MHDIIVIAGTDFGVGKTWVTCALARSLTARGNELRALKLVETGRDAANGDAGVLAAATGQASPTEALANFPDLLTAAQAAERAGAALDIDAMVAEVRRIAAVADVTLVEGSGGLLTPITWDCTVVDVARRLGAMAVVVAPDRRGTLNHTLLTLGALAAANVNCLGVALNGFGPPDESTGSNAAALRRLAPGTRVIETHVTGWEKRLV